MFRRVRWLGAGAALGAGATVWTQRKIKGAVARYRPAGLAGSAVDKALAWPAEVRAAIVEGRRAMRQREAELRHGLVPPALGPRPATMGPRRPPRRAAPRPGPVRAALEETPTGRPHQPELRHGLQDASRP